MQYKVTQIQILLNNKGYSLIEMLTAIVVSLTVLGAVVLAYTASLKVFKDAKSISDNIETKTPSIELIARYFDRWGAGVVSKNEKPGCNNCPETQKTITITTTNGCSDVTFYGNLYGFGYVKEVEGTTSTAAKLISCRLDSRQSPTNRNCYTLWRNNTPLNDLVLVNNNLIPLGLVSLSINNADCSTITSSIAYNATMDDEMSPWEGNAWRVVRPGDVIHRAAHRIRLYCNSNPNDSNRKWLYVDLTEQYGDYCKENEIDSPVAPVNDFQVKAISKSPTPPGTSCSETIGGTGCEAVNVTITFRSESKRYGGAFDTYQVTKIFGR